MTLAHVRLNIMKNTYTKLKHLISETLQSAQKPQYT
jgi:hypothetical protein